MNGSASPGPLTTHLSNLDYVAAILGIIREYIEFWPLAVITCILSLIGKVSAIVFKPYTSGYRWWLNKTLTLQPLFWATLMAVAFRPRVPGITTIPETILVCWGCGIVSVFLYQAAKGLAKKRGYDVDLPGLDGENDDQ
jgi:hypothetical protein